MSIRKLILLAPSTALAALRALPAAGADKEPAGKTASKPDMTAQSFRKLHALIRPPITCQVVRPAAARAPALRRCPLTSRECRTC